MDILQELIFWEVMDIFWELSILPLPVVEGVAEEDRD